MFFLQFYILKVSKKGLTSFFPVTPTIDTLNLLIGPLHVFITEYFAPVSTKNQLHHLPALLEPGAQLGKYRFLPPVSIQNLLPS